MVRRPTVVPPVAHPPGLADLDPFDVGAIRMLLRGDSVIDWHRLSFADHAQVERFLRLNEFHPGVPREMDRLEEIRSDAVDYLARAFSISVPDEIAGDVAVQDLFLIASKPGMLQKWACVVLKVMHIIHHINGRQTLTKVAVSDDDIFREIELKVMHVVEELRAVGLPISEFEWSRKPLDSLVTKLLAKRSTIAASIYDKLRFRLIVPNPEDLAPTLATLTRQLIPFNYVVPGESVNQLVDVDTLLPSGTANHRPPRSTKPPMNEFSGAEYRIVNFVADLPLRLERVLKTTDHPPGLSHVVFVLTEFQLVDKRTAQANETGDCSHESYKARQQDRVRQRLFRDPGEPIPE